MLNLNGRKKYIKARFIFLYSFMENFQTEVLEIEFNEFSHGFKTISDLDFAEILLRYTNFDRDTKKSILKRVKKTTHQADVGTKEFFLYRIKFLLI
jgi:hypothetical protein